MEIKIIAVVVLVLAAICLGVIIAQELPQESIYEDLEDIDEEAENERQI